MDLSVLIPTHRRPDAIRTCLCHLASQQTDAAFEILIGLDGDVSETPDPDVPEVLADRTQTVRFGRIGLLRLRHALMERARGRVVLWLNDDSYAASGLIAAHVGAHESRVDRRVVVGRADWKPIDHPNLFDRMVQETDLVFFTQPPDHVQVPTTYRNCFGLNMSFSRELAIRAGNVAEVSEHYGYEDIELAWRMTRLGAQCVYQPGARVVHDHRYQPIDVHRREYLLGRAASAFAESNPDFASQLFGSDLRRSESMDGFRQSIMLNWRDASRIESSFLNLDQMPAEASSSALLPTLSEHWVLLKRLLWRWGVLDASHEVKSRWSLLAETSPEQVLCALPDQV